MEEVLTSDVHERYLHAGDFVEVPTTTSDHSPLPPVLTLLKSPRRVWQPHAGASSGEHRRYLSQSIVADLAVADPGPPVQLRAEKSPPPPPASSQEFCDMAEAYAKQGRHEDALVQCQKHLNRVVTQHGSEPQEVAAACNLLARAHYRLDQYDEAWSYHQRSLEILKNAPSDFSATKTTSQQAPKNGKAQTASRPDNHHPAHRKDPDESPTAEPVGDEEGVRQKQQLIKEFWARRISLLEALCHASSHVPSAAPPACSAHHTHDTDTAATATAEPATTAAALSGSESEGEGTDDGREEKLLAALASDDRSHGILQRVVDLWRNRLLGAALGSWKGVSGRMHHAGWAVWRWCVCVCVCFFVYIYVYHMYIYVYR